MIETNAKLKPCPFCGSRQLLMYNVIYDSTIWSIDCKNCGIQVAIKREPRIEESHGQKLFMGYKSSREKLIKAWNSRVNEALDKQIPRKVDKGEHCPNCTAGLTRWEPYCSICGQKLDWSDKNDGISHQSI